MASSFFICSECIGGSQLQFLEPVPTGAWFSVAGYWVVRLTFDHCELTPLFLLHPPPLCPQVFSQWALQKLPETQMTAETCDLHIGQKELVIGSRSGPF